MRLEGTPLGADGPVPLSDVGVFAGPCDLDALSRLAREALAARELPALFWFNKNCAEIALIFEQRTHRFLRSIRIA